MMALYWFLLVAPPMIMGYFAHDIFGVEPSKVFGIPTFWLIVLCGGLWGVLCSIFLRPLFEAKASEAE